MDGWEINFSSSWFGREFRLKIIKLLPSSFVAGVKILKKKNNFRSLRAGFPFYSLCYRKYPKITKRLIFSETLCLVSMFKLLGRNGHSQVASAAPFGWNKGSSTMGGGPLGLQLVPVSCACCGLPDVMGNLRGPPPSDATFSLEIMPS